ncbi:ArsR/SmtB family transcription factor [Haliovirga abyssi]|uniref:HTH arsR-type domain-containing protein n=1 Tax=Haliovirga abyssi TaxID=2996794 RepID=A0AAU9DWR6_9FUSO|nr:metalloregulator ArsR/SmtB family transcription factor [Haliovirga abyssi]BDU49715.1 hypothetical protein HLVA_02840 [Haliovirga abyssi]
MEEILKVSKGLSDKTRLKILLYLIDGEKCVCDISRHISRSQPTTSLQLIKLESLGLVSFNIYGRSRCYYIKSEKVKRIFEIFELKNQ